MKFEIVEDMDSAFEGADIVYPKSWGAFMTPKDSKESQRIAEKYRSWICNERRMDLTGREALYMHCLPADRGYEVTDAVIDGPRSVVYDQAENRPHTAKAIMALTM